ncbi:uncharacterized protein LOC134336983 [Mobula hypostoma]|uniref:uncharacterized protein LOC134336983 n=1 Tax=Mobula hypostoma TaxID=723540 RepID=UPI002FC290A9
MEASTPPVHGVIPLCVQTQSVPSCEEWNTLLAVPSQPLLFTQGDGAKYIAPRVAPSPTETGRCPRPGRQPPLRNSPKARDSLETGPACWRSFQSENFAAVPVRSPGASRITGRESLQSTVPRWLGARKGSVGLAETQAGRGRNVLPDAPAPAPTPDEKSGKQWRRNVAPMSMGGKRRRLPPVLERNGLLASCQRPHLGATHILGSEGLN